MNEEKILIKKTFLIIFLYVISLERLQIEVKCKQTIPHGTNLAHSLLRTGYELKMIFTF